jgi:hypothetical protein
LFQYCHQTTIAYWRQAKQASKRTADDRPVVVLPTSSRTAQSKMATCGRHKLGSDDEDDDGAADRHDPAVQAVMEERRRQRAAATAGAASSPAPAPAVVVVPAPLPTSTAEQRAEAQRMRAGAAARTRASGWYHAQEQRRVVVAAADAGAAADGGGAEDAADRRRRQHLWARQNAAAIGAKGASGEAAESSPDHQQGQQHQQEQQQQPQEMLPLCKKCKAVPAVAWLRQHEPLCGACARDGALGKARVNLRGVGRLRAGDRVTAALSGGYGSLGMLAALLQMRASAGAATARPEKGRTAFDVSVVHVRESALEWLPLAPAGIVASATSAQKSCDKGQDDDDNADACAVVAAWERVDPAVAEARQRAERRADALERSLRDAMRALGFLKEGEEGSGREFLVVRLEDVFSMEQGEEKEGGTAAAPPAPPPPPSPANNNLLRLQQLLTSVRDATAREDLAESLRDQLLRRVAASRGCHALVLGDTAGTIARRVVAAAAKGRAFAVPADVAAAAVAPDGTLAVLRPVRDVTAAELAVSFRHASGWLRSPDEEEEEEERESRRRQAAAASSAAAAAAASLSWSSGGNHRAPASINALTRGFVSAIEAHMPSSIYAVLRSAGALQAFEFNEDAALEARRRGGGGGGGVGAGGDRPKSQRRRPPGQEEKQEEAEPDLWSPDAPAPKPDPSARCSVCSCPLLPAERARGGGGGGGAGSGEEPSAHHPWPAGSLGALDGGGAQGVCFCCERQVLDAMVDAGDDDEGGHVDGARRRQREKEQEEEQEEEEQQLPCEAERRARRARRSRPLARLAEMLPTDPTLSAPLPLAQ